MGKYKKGNIEFKEMLENICRKNADKPFVVYMRNNGSKNVFTFQAIYEDILKAKDMFIEAGLISGDRVAIIAPHSPLVIHAGLSLAYCGITSVLIESSLPVEEIDRLLENSDVRAVFTIPKIYEKLNKQLINDIPAFELGNNYRFFPGAATHVNKEVTADPDEDIIAILYSSGTTSSMKAIMVTYASILESSKILFSILDIKLDDTCLHVLPFNHIAGFSISFSLFLSGITSYMIEDVDPLKLQKGFLDFKPSIFAMVPKFFEVVEKKIETEIHNKGKLVEYGFYRLLDFSHFMRKNFGLNIGRYLFKEINRQVFGGNLTKLGLGSSPCKESTNKFFVSLGYEWLNFYASTETGVPVSAINANERYPMGHIGNVTRHEGIHIKINEPGADGIGEIYVKSILMMKGYFRDTKATAASFDNGYFKTGDLGYIDSKNNLHITGRIKETIILHTGKKVSPVDIENFYGQLCPEVSMTCCGVPDRECLFDEIHLFIEKSNYSLDKLAQVKRLIMDYSSQKSSIYKIAQIHFINKLPMTSVGKVKRYQLKELALLERNGKLPVENQNNNHPKKEKQDIEEIIYEIISNLASPQEEMELTPQLRLNEDLVFDSLTMLDMYAQIESALDINIIENIERMETIEDIITLAKSGECSGKKSKDKTYDIMDYPLNKKRIHVASFKFLMKLSKVLWKFEVNGVENIPKEKNYILCPNHESHLDGLWVWSANPYKNILKICCLAKQEHLDSKVSQFGLAVLGGIPVDRYGNPLPAMKRCSKCIKDEQYSVLIHPEGTRTRDGKMNEFKSGSAKLSIDTGVSIIPVRIDGAREIYNPDSMLPKVFNWKKLSRFTLKISFGKPITPEGKSVKEITLLLKKAVEELGENN